MNREEVSNVLAFLQAAYRESGAFREDATVQVWARDLAPLAYRPAIETADLWHKSQPWPPKVSDFLQLYDSLVRRMSPALPKVRSDEAWIVKGDDTGPADLDSPPPKDESIAKARAQLAKADKPPGHVLSAFGLELPKERM